MILEVATSASMRAAAKHIHERDTRVRRPAQVRAQTRHAVQTGQPRGRGTGKPSYNANGACGCRPRGRRIGTTSAQAQQCGQRGANSRPSGL